MASNNTASVKKSQEKLLDKGGLRYRGILPPESARIARAMVDQGVARNTAHAIHLALLNMLSEDQGT